jgi:phage FluMu protein Com
MNEIRCPACKRLLAEAEFSELRIKCPRCKAFTHLRAKSPRQNARERQEGDDEHGKPVSKSEAARAERF